MANVFANDYGQKPLSVQGNNAFAENYSVAKGAASGDKVYLGILPAGVEIDSLALVHDDAGTGVTCKLGFEPLNASDGPTAVTDYWLPAATDIATAAGRIESKAQPIRFDFPVAIVLTTAGAAFTGTPKITAVAKGKALGVK